MGIFELTMKNCAICEERCYVFFRVLKSSLCTSWLLKTQPFKVAVVVTRSQRSENSNKSFSFCQMS